MSNFSDSQDLSEHVFQCREKQHILIELNHIPFLMLRKLAHFGIEL